MAVEDMGGGYFKEAGSTGPGAFHGTREAYEADKYYNEHANKGPTEYEKQQAAADEAFHNEMAEKRAKLKADMKYGPTTEYVDGLREKGRACREKEDWDSAISAYTTLFKFMDEHASDPKAMIVNQSWKKFGQNYKALLGDSYFQRSIDNLRKKNHDQAKADITEALKWYPFDDVLRTLMQKTLDERFVAGSTNGNTSANQKAYDAYTDSGYAKMDKEDFAGAIADFRAALNLSPADELAMANLAMAYCMRADKYNDDGDFDNAYLDIKTALEMDPNVLQGNGNILLMGILEAKPSLNDNPPQKRQEDIELEKILAAPPPQKRSAPSASTAGTSTPTAAGTSAGAAPAASGPKKGNGFLAFMFGVITAPCVGMLAAWAASNYFGDAGPARMALLSAAVVTFIVSFIAWRKKAVLLILVALALAAAGVYVTVKEPELPFKAKQTAATFTTIPTTTVTADALNVREGPSADTALVTQLKKGDPLTVTEDTGAAWVKVEAEGKTGYVNRDYITTAGE
jgi:tetratricopeptide (TPR) repeat protein